MKKIILLILVLHMAFVSAIGQFLFQKLTIPAFERKIVAKDGSIFLLGYCSDATRKWPETGKALTNLNYAGDKTNVILQIKGHTQQYPLSKVINTYIRIESAPAKIKPLNELNQYFKRPLGTDEYKGLANYWPKFVDQLSNIRTPEELLKNRDVLEVYKYLIENLKDKKYFTELQISGIEIKSINGAKIISIESGGFNVSVEPENVNEIISAIKELPKDLHKNYVDYKNIQDDFWRKVHEPEMRDPKKKHTRIEEIVAADFNRKKKKSPLWEIKVDEKNKIEIYERNKPNDKPAFSAEDFSDKEYLHLDEIVAELEEEEDFKACININPADSSIISISFSGKIGKVIPCEIEFHSDFSINGSVELIEQKVNKDGSYKGKLILERKFSTKKDENDDCSIKPSVTLCWPLIESTLQFDVCGLKVSLASKIFEIKL